MDHPMITFYPYDQTIVHFRVHFICHFMDHSMITLFPVPRPPGGGRPPSPPDLGGRTPSSSSPGPLPSTILPPTVATSAEG
jgi:hypothetical protein